MVRTTSLEIVIQRDVCLAVLGINMLAVSAFPSSCNLVKKYSRLKQRVIIKDSLTSCSEAMFWKASKVTYNLFLSWLREKSGKERPL